MKFIMSEIQNIKMKTNLILASLFLLGTFSVKAQKKEAEDFALTFVKSMIEKDCEAFSACFAENIVLLQKKQVLVKSKMSKELCGMCKVAVMSDSVDMEYYQKNFEFDIYDYAEIKKNDKFIEFRKQIELNPDYKLDKKDFFFIGYIHKTANFNDYILNDPFCVIFRQTSVGFEIVVFAGN